MRIQFCKANHTIQRIRCFLFLAVLVLFSAACGDKQLAEPQDSGPKMNTKNLAYGVSIAVPDTWVIATAVGPEAASRQALDARVGKGDQVPLLVMQRLAQTPEGKDAMVGVFLLEAAKHIPPESQAAALNAEGLEAFSKNILESDHKTAARQGEKSNLLSWSVSKSQVAGHLALVHKGRAKGVTGELSICDAYVYLPAGKGLAVRSISDPAVPGTEALITAIIDSVRVSK